MSFKDKWDEDEKKPFDGQMARDSNECKHWFDPVTGQCLNCRKTREEIRKELSLPYLEDVFKLSKEESRKKSCARAVHHVNTERGMADIMRDGKTYCDDCGVILEWRQSEDGIYEFWEVT